MALMVPVRPETEAWLQEAAAREGVSKEAVAARPLDNQWATARRIMPDAGEGAALMTQIREELPPEFRARYRVLHERLEAEGLTDKERREFLRMTTQAERLNTKRMTALFAMAQRQGVTLNEIMQKLGVGPVQAA